MKNLFLLPTEKPSRLAQVHKKLSFFKNKKWDNTENWRCKNIYITNDEDIIIGDYYIAGVDIYQCLSSIELEDLSIDSYCKKIILTTDQDLIKDGVQSIDDEFLEWFVKNPSCEKVGVINTFDYNKKHFVEHSGYKIIIPKEEPKQETTLEEFIKKQLSLGKYQDQESAIRHSIELGAKWQQEQICNHNYNLISEQGHRVIKCSKCNHTQPI